MFIYSAYKNNNSFSAGEQPQFLYLVSGLNLYGYPLNMLLTAQNKTKLGGKQTVDLETFRLSTALTMIAFKCMMAKGPLREDICIKLLLHL